MSYKDVILERIAGDGSAKRRLNWAGNPDCPVRGRGKLFC